MDILSMNQDWLQLCQQSDTSKRDSARIFHFYERLFHAIANLQEEFCHGQSGFILNLFLTQ